MRRVLLSKEISRPAMAALEQNATVSILSTPTEEALKEAVAEVEAVILRTNVQFTREAIAAARKLKLISRTGVGVDNVDVPAATERGIMVCNTPGINTNSVAEHTVTLILALSKRISVMDRAVREGNWMVRDAQTTVDVEGKTLGLLGVGAIGSAVARKCRLGFDMKIIAFDPYVAEMEGVEFRPSPDDVFREADVVSIHVPSTDSTHHLVDRRMLSLMKPGAYIINTARGSIVDEAALKDALRDGRIAGAGLDVFEVEPPEADNPLLRLDSVIVTPHAAALTQECEAKVALAAVQAVLDYFSGRPPRNVVNKDLLAGVR